MRRAASAALAMASALYVFAVPAQGGSDPHSSLDTSGACGDCHLDEVKRGQPVQRPLRFKKDIVSICLGCHLEKDVSTLHPVDIRPGMEVPADLPLDEEETITCATCHNPHMRFEGKKPFVAEELTKRLLSLFTINKTYRTFYLRRANDKGQLCKSCHPEGRVGGAGFHVQDSSILDSYVGSVACSQCHREKYKQWRLTPHARMARDPIRDPEAIVGDFENNPPFDREEVEVVLGSRWTQRYIVRKNDRQIVKAPIWSITANKWDLGYWNDRPWDQFCQGCHTTGLEIKEGPQYSELGIGCEACHGPGKAHSRSGGQGAIVNPAKLDPDRREMVCEACHTSGHDRTGQFRFPLGYLPGKDLRYFYKGLKPKPGQDNSSFMGDGSYTDRRRQWLFWVEEYFNVRGQTCDICKNFRQRLDDDDDVTMTVSQHCVTCHVGELPNPELHAKHMESDVECHKCHMPQVSSDPRKYSIHDHKFFFGQPESLTPLPVDKTCETCHDDAN